MNSDNECKKIINRMVLAYDSKTIKALSDLLDTTVSVIGNRVARNSIPYDLIVKCAIDTGANLKWILTGEGEAGIDGTYTVKKEVVLSDDILEKLERLTALKEKGSITEQEFNLLKSNLI